MNRRILFVLGIAGVLALAGAVTDASAACNPTKDFKTAFGSADHFLNFPGDADTTIGGPALIGRFWQSGARGAANEGVGCPEVTYLLDLGGPIAVFGQMGGDILGTGGCDNTGCPAFGSDLITLIQTLSTDGSKAYYAVGKVNDLNLGEYDYGRGGTDWQVAEVPRPRVTMSSRTGGTVTLNLSFDPPAGAYGQADGYAPESILTGYQVVRFEGTADPGRAPAAWTNIGALIPVGSTGATLGGFEAVCGGTTNDVFIAMRPVFDNGQFSGDYVGASTRIECDPAVADPRFKMIDRTKSGRSTIRSNR
jgi:hypothetical protein